MKNMGPKSSQWLASVGIYTLDDVAKLGVVETYKRVKAAYPEKVSLNCCMDSKPLCWTCPGKNFQLISKTN